MERDTKQKWAAFAAILFVSVGTAWGSCALKNHLVGELPQPAPPEPLPYVEPTPSDSEIDLSSEDEDPPKQPSSIEASAAARPPWSTAVSYAPDHSDPRTVFNSGTPIDVPLSRRLVACNVTAFAAATTAGGELEIRVHVGATPERFARGQNGVVWTVLPLASLAEGESLRIEAFVRRKDKATEIARASAKLTGGELTFRLPARPPSDHPELAMECRAVSPHDVEGLFAKDAARADAAIRSRKPEDARRAPSDLAALVGWDDPRVKKRVGALATTSASGRF